MNVWHLVLCVVILALAYIFFQYARIRKLPEGTDEMQEMAGIIRDGASTFLKTEFRVIAIVVIVVAAVFSLFVEKTSGITFIMGACMSSVVCILGMRSATYANVRTSNRARETLSIGETVKVALGGGSVSGLAVQAFGMLGMVLVLIIWNGVDPTAVGTGFLANLECNPTIMRITTYSLGCSIVAMFNRVAGGNYTKAADISSDILAKLRHDMPEDDSRVPNVIADFIGDNVNDIAGNCSDLLESFVATMAAALMIAVTIYKSALSGGTEAVTEATFTATTVFPIVLAGCGLFGCLLGLGYATIKKMGDNPSHELNLSTWISAGLTVVGGFVAAKLIFADVPLYASFRCGWLSPWISSRPWQYRLMAWGRSFHSASSRMRRDRLSGVSFGRMSTACWAIIAPMLPSISAKNAVAPVTRQPRSSAARSGASSQLTNAGMSEGYTPMMRLRNCVDITPSGILYPARITRSMSISRSLLDMAML